jgi:hypothetical protein
MELGDSHKTFREYLHTCGGKTEYFQFNYDREILAPLRINEYAFCDQCRDYFDFREMTWAGTNETLAEHFAELKRTYLRSRRDFKEEDFKRPVLITIEALRKLRKAWLRSNFQAKGFLFINPVKCETNYEMSLSEGIDEGSDYVVQEMPFQVAAPKSLELTSPASAVVDFSETSQGFYLARLNPDLTPYRFWGI